MITAKPKGLDTILPNQIVFLLKYQHTNHSHNPWFDLNQFNLHKFYKQCTQPASQSNYPQYAPQSHIRQWTIEAKLLLQLMNLCQNLLLQPDVTVQRRCVVHVVTWPGQSSTTKVYHKKGRTRTHVSLKFLTKDMMWFLPCRAVIPIGASQSQTRPCYGPRWTLCYGLLKTQGGRSWSLYSIIIVYFSSKGTLHVPIFYPCI